MSTDFIQVARPSVGEEEIRAVTEVLLSGQFVSGPKVEAFEQAFADYTGTEYAVAVNSGTAALHIALGAMGIGKGDEVIVPPITFFATVSSVLYVGAKPVFADIDAQDLCLSPESVLARLTDKTKAVIPVHLFGMPAEMDKLAEIAGHQDLYILEDCAQAHGSQYKGKKVGSIGTAGAFSFFATKHITTGEGGIITTNSRHTAEECRIIRNHGMAGRDDHVRLGFNNRMTEMGAAMGIVQLKKLDTFNQRRIENSEHILASVRKMPWAAVPVPAETCRKHTYFWCPVMVKPESGKTIMDLKEHLANHRIGFRERYREPLYRQPILSSLHPEVSGQYLPNAEKVAGNIIGLPNHPLLSEDEKERILEAIRSFS